MIDQVYKIFGFTYQLALSTRPLKYIGDLNEWNNAELNLQSVLDAFTAKKSMNKWSLHPGDGAFYGPKIDVMVNDASGKQHQLATVQLDFNLPVRFNLRYQDCTATSNPTDTSSYGVPVLVHRAILGSIERFMAVLTEMYQGKWPFWISPRQCRIIPVSASSPMTEYALDIKQRLTASGYYVDLDSSDNSLSKKIRNATLESVNYVVILGEKEMNKKSVTLRSWDGKQNEMSVEELVQYFRDATILFK
jgi:threonyl-tRNA synthetase